MKDIPPIAVQVKLSDGHEDQHILVHDGRQVIALAEPGVKVGTHPSNTMLAGTRVELEAEIARLKLAAPRPRWRADRSPPEPPPPILEGAFSPRGQP